MLTCMEKLKAANLKVGNLIFHGGIYNETML
jgi:hypothetical protein